MKIPTKFELNTEDFKIYFDNKKKTHVCENLETGEKTNIGVLGIFMQMGILKQMEQRQEKIEEISALTQRIESLEGRIDNLAKTIDSTAKTKTEVPSEELKKPDKPKLEEIEDLEKKLPKEKPGIKEHIMEKALEKTEPEEPPEDVTLESEEEIDNWMSI